MLTWEQIVHLQVGDGLYRNDGVRFVVDGELQGRYSGWGHHRYPSESYFELPVRSQFGWSKITPSNSNFFMTEAEFIRRNGIQTLLPRAKKHTLENPRPLGSPSKQVRFKRIEGTPYGPQLDIETALARHAYASLDHYEHPCDFCYPQDFGTRENYVRHYRNHSGEDPKDYSSWLSRYRLW